MSTGANNGLDALLRTVGGSDVLSGYSPIEPAIAMSRRRRESRH